MTTLHDCNILSFASYHEWTDGYCSLPHPSVTLTSTPRRRLAATHSQNCQLCCHELPYLPGLLVDLARFPSYHGGRSFAWSSSLSALSRVFLSCLWFPVKHLISSSSKHALWNSYHYPLAGWEQKYETLKQARRPIHPTAEPLSGQAAAVSLCLHSRPQQIAVIKSFWHFSELDIILHWNEHMKIWKKT